MAMRRCLPAILLSLLMITLRPSGIAQTKSTLTLTVDVNTVLLTATVRDRHGNLIQDLTRDDFALADDGRPEAINYFVHDTDLPLSLGLLIDASGSQRAVLPRERTASRRFLDQMLTDSKDQAFLIRFYHEGDPPEDPVFRREASPSAPQQSRYPKPGSSYASRHSRSRHGGGTTLYDTIYLASHGLLGKQPGRKAMIVLSDGVDHGSKGTLKSAMQAAQRADITIYAIYFEGHEPGGGSGSMGAGRYRGMGQEGGRGGWQQPRVDGRQILEQMCRATGGRLFELNKKTSIDDVYASMAEELRNQYVIGFTSEKSAQPGFHKLTLKVKVKVKERGLRVQARGGYYAP